MIPRLLLACLLFAAVSMPSFADDGYELWLRYRADPQSTPVSTLIAGTGSPTLDAAAAELERGLAGLGGRAPARGSGITGLASLVIGPPRTLPLLASLPLGLERVGSEGYVIRRLDVHGKPATVIAANSDVGALYGAFHFLRLVQTHQPLDSIDVVSAPRTRIRVLDHWDNLDRHVERGYAGESLW